MGWEHILGKLKEIIQMIRPGHCKFGFYVGFLWHSLVWPWRMLEKLEIFRNLKSYFLFHCIFSQEISTKIFFRYNRSSSWFITSKTTDVPSNIIWLSFFPWSWKDLNSTIELSLYLSSQLNSNQFYKHLVSTYYIQSTVKNALNNSMCGALWCITYFHTHYLIYVVKIPLIIISYLNCLELQMISYFDFVLFLMSP